MTIRDSYVEQINLLENTLKMYDKTRDEMITHGAEIDSLEKIDAEINRVSVDLNFYKKLLNKLDNKISDDVENLRFFKENQEQIVKTFIPVPQNRFLVKFPNDIDLNTQDVLSINGGVYGDYNINSLNIIFREFERENFCLPYLLTKLIKDRVKFNIIVETLKPNLDILYVTEYVDVRFTQFTDSDKDYSSDDINKYIVKAVFDDVKYYVPLKNETSC